MTQYPLNILRKKLNGEKNINLVPPNFPLCNYKEETRDHYNFDFPEMTTFRKNKEKNDRKERLYKRRIEFKKGRRKRRKYKNNS